MYLRILIAVVHTAYKGHSSRIPSRLSVSGVLWRDAHAVIRRVPQPKILAEPLRTVVNTSMSFRAILLFFFINIEFSQDTEHLALVVRAYIIRRGRKGTLAQDEIFRTLAKFDIRNLWKHYPSTQVFIDRESGREDSLRLADDGKYDIARRCR
jgi:hypothetical protein